MFSVAHPHHAYWFANRRANRQRGGARRDRRDAGRAPLNRSKFVRANALSGQLLTVDGDPRQALALRQTQQETEPGARSLLEETIDADTAVLKERVNALPTQRDSQIADLLPHRWAPAT